MPLVEDERIEDLQAELSALRHEKACLILEMKSNSPESLRNLEAMMRYSVVNGEIRAAVDVLRLLGEAA
jgi:DNA-directed RNA polymerase subunit F